MYLKGRILIGCPSFTVQSLSTCMMHVAPVGYTWSNCQLQYVLSPTYMQIFFNLRKVLNGTTTDSDYMQKKNSYNRTHYVWRLFVTYSSLFLVDILHLWLMSHFWFEEGRSNFVETVGKFKQTWRSDLVQTVGEFKQTWRLTNTDNATSSTPICKSLFFRMVFNA
jgi:hypothetical protein